MLNSTTVDYNVLLNNQLKAYCASHMEDPFCVSIRLDGEITFDDVDYTVEIPANTTAAVTYIGSYIPASLIIIGVIGNLICLCRGLCFLKNGAEEVHVYIKFIALLNTIYLCTASLSQVLRTAGIIQPVIHLHYLSCMLWPSLTELIANITRWAVAALAIYLNTPHSESKTNTTVPIFLARVKCLSIVTVMVFLNFHSTLLRELDQDECTISAKAGVFYRDFWPWFRISCCTYLPWLVTFAALMKYCTSTLTCRGTRHSFLLRSITGLCWLYVIANIPRLILLPYEYYLMKSKGEGDNPQSLTILYLQISREMCVTAMHSLASIPILLVMFGKSHHTSTRHQVQTDTHSQPLYGEN